MEQKDTRINEHHSDDFKISSLITRYRPLFDIPAISQYVYERLIALGRRFSNICWLEDFRRGVFWQPIAFISFSTMLS